jgi:hypothetical protein
MEHDETYKGQRLHVTTMRESNGLWRGFVTLVDSGATLQSPFVNSEEEAHRAAVSAAMAEIDRSRAGIGKP